MLAAAFPSGGAGVQEGLDLLPRLRIDDGFVGAEVKGALVSDLPDVVRIAQQFEERRALHGPRQPLRRRDRG